MKYQRKTFIVSIGFCIIILIIASCTCLSRQAAYKKVYSELRDKERIVDFRLICSWPFHWHVIIEEQIQETPNYFLNPAETNEYLNCISLTGERLLILPKRKIEERTMQELSDPKMRMRCVYHKGKEWVVLTEPAVKKIMEQAKGE
jgi:hypothetical protein